MQEVSTSGPTCHEVPPGLSGPTASQDDLSPQGRNPAGTRWVHVKSAGTGMQRHERSQPVARNRTSDDDGAPDPEKVKAAISELLARRPRYAKRIGGDVGQGARPGQAERGAMGIIQSRTRQIRCYWYRWIIEGGMTKS